MVNQSFREKLLKIIHLYGEYPKESIDLLWDSKNYASKKVSELIKKGVIRETVSEYKDVFMDEKFGRKRTVIRKIKRLTPARKKQELDGNGNLLPAEAANGKKRIRSGLQWVERGNRVTECMTMFSESGAVIETDTELKMSDIKLSKTDSIAYTTTEIKKIYGEEFNKTNQYRSCAIGITPGGTYIAYNLKNKLIEWSQSGELKMKGLAEDITRKKQNIRKTVKINALLFTKNPDIGARLIFNTDESITKKTYQKTSQKKELINITDIYDNTYLLPLSRIGIKRMKWMYIPDWEHILNQMMYTDEDIERAKGSYADAISKNKKIYLTYANGNIGNLLRFYYGIKTHPENQHVLKIVSEQEEMVRKIFGSSAEYEIYETEQICKAMDTYSETMKTYIRD